MRWRRRGRRDGELEKLCAHFDGNPRQIIPMSRIIKFAVATAMRQEEICRVTWSDLNTRTKMLTIRDRKDPREKKGNDQRIPPLAVSGFDALALIEEQRAIRGNEDDRIFPYHHKSAGTAFTRACQGPRDQGSPLPRPAPRRHEPSVRGGLRHRTGGAGHRPQGLEDAAALHAP